MSSLHKLKSGSYRYQLICVEGKRRECSLGKINKKAAETLKSYFDSVAQSVALNEVLDANTQKWLSNQNDTIKKKLTRLGLLSQRATIPTSISGFTNWYIEQHKPKKESRRKLKNAGAKLIDFSGDIQLREVTRGMAERYYKWMVEEKKLSEGHSRRTIGYAKQLFLAAVEEKLLEEEPFKKLSARVRSDKERQFYIDTATASKILEACPSNVWRLRFALLRWQGLRCPSEMNSLSWTNVKIDENKMSVKDAKRKHYGPEKAIRVPAIMPEVLPYLEQQFNDAPEGQEFVLPKLSHKNYTKVMLRILNNAGVKPWPKLFNNLRASGITDALDHHPSHVVNEWFGNSEAISREHYRMVTDDHYAKAAQRASVISHESPQIFPQPASAKAETSDKDDGKDAPDRSGNEKIRQSTEIPATTGFTKWAMRDSNPRPPRCKRGALAN